MKTCTSCGVEKSFADFSKHKLGLNGLRPTCRDCCKTAGKAYREATAEHQVKRHAAYRAENASAIKAAGARYREENRERELARGAAWRQANPERERQRSAAYREANRDKDAARKAAYAKANPEVMRAIQSRRRAAKKEVGGSYTASDVKRLMNLQKGKCTACRVDIRSLFHIDHIVPLKLGGCNDVSNLQLMCPRCNQTKNASHPVDFMQKKGYLL